MAPTTTITHALFDMDGLLLDTEACYSAAQVSVLEALGVDGARFTPALKAKMMGRRALEAATVLVDELGLAGVVSPEEFVARREAELAALFPAAALMPGAARVVAHLVDVLGAENVAVATSSHRCGRRGGRRGVPRGARLHARARLDLPSSPPPPFLLPPSSPSRRHFELKSASHASLFSSFGHIVTGDDPAVTAGKPDPSIFVVAASRFPSPPRTPSTVLVFEDAPIGVRAAVAAGMRCVHVPDARWSVPGSGAGGGAAACAVVPSLEAWRPEDWGLPPYAD